MTTHDWQSFEDEENPINVLFENALDSYEANPTLIREHAEQEDWVKTSGYSTRTILELLQNAADALKGTAGTDDPRHIEIILDKETRTLYVANSGNPFTLDGARSLTHAHISDKRGEEIGRFGLGFKSVLAVTNQPQVFSRSMSFYFDQTKASKAIRGRVPGSRRNMPILRTPFPIDAVSEMRDDPVLEKLGESASTIVRLPDLDRVPELEEELRNFNAHMLLFTPDVRSISTRVIGDQGWEAHHGLVDAGDSEYILESGDREETWKVRQTTYKPDAQDRKRVGHAVAREEVTISVAVPLQLGQGFRGQFWSYFPLNDQTTAKAIFNAPWSVNADRTTLQNYQYNKKMLAVAAELFVELLPELSDPSDVGRHFDYLPSRLRDARGDVDEVLTDHILNIASDSPIVPDADMQFQMPSDLRPLTFVLDHQVEEKVHRGWQRSPHTGSDVPHSTLYARDRAAKLRTIFERSAGLDALDVANYWREKALQSIPHRSPIAFLKELAQGPDLDSTSLALDLNTRHPEFQKYSQAPVIPTTNGYKALRDSSSIFLSNPSGLQFDRASFITKEFLERREAPKLLERAGIRPLDPNAILRAILVDTQRAFRKGEFWSVLHRYGEIWQAVRNVPYPVALEELRKSEFPIKVPTVGGEWRDPEEVIHFEGELPLHLQKFQLNTAIAPAEVALGLGVLGHGLSKDRDPEHEWYKSEYLDYIAQELSDELGRSLTEDDIEVYPQSYSGPYSLLPFLKESGASDQRIVAVTKELIQNNSLETWEAEVSGQHRLVEVTSPVVWALKTFGLLESTLGMRNPFEIASPAITPFDGLVPTLFIKDASLARPLRAPENIKDLPSEAVESALNQDEFSPIAHAISDKDLTQFVLEASSHAFGNERPYSIPSRDGNRLVASVPSNVFVAREAEEVETLKDRGKRYLFAKDEATANRLYSEVGCQDFSNHFSFSLITSGLSEPELILDTFSTLRRSSHARSLEGITVQRASQVIKRTNAPDGTEDRHLEHFFDQEARILYVVSGIENEQIIHILNHELALGLSELDVEEILKVQEEESLRSMKLEARTKQTDAEKLNCYFDDEILKGSLPSGLWRSLEDQGLVDDNSSVAELLISVDGNSTIERLRPQFVDLGFVPPHRWMNNRSTIDWLSDMGFGPEYAPRPSQAREAWFTVPGRVILNDLHDYQKDIRTQLTDLIQARDDKGRATKQIVELPTGAGKTRVAVQTVVEMFCNGLLSGPVLWIAQTQELCEQAVVTWSEIWSGFDDPRPLTIGRLWETNSVPEPITELSVIVATDHKLNNVFESDEYDWLKEARLVIIDEAHRAGSSPMYTKILTHLGIDGRHWERPLVGLTATPFRGNSESETESLLRRFGGGETIKPFGAGNAYQELTEMGILAKVKHEIIQGAQLTISKTDRDNIMNQGLVPSAVLDNLGQDRSRNADLVRHIMSQDPTWPILVFTPSVISAQVLAATLRYQGKTAASIDANTPISERNRIISVFKRHGEDPSKDTIQILVNCDVLTQGFDAPAVRALYIAKPTFSPNRYIQMVGRGLRGPLNGGKETCLIVDIQDNFGGDQELNDKMAFFEYRELWQSVN